MSRLFCAKTALRAVSRQQFPTSTTTRSFSSFPLLRPTSTSSPSSFSRRPTAPTIQTTLSTTTPVDGEVADVVPKSSITSHPALSGLATQIRCGPRKHMNMNRPSRLIRARRSGFLSRLKTKAGRKLVKRRAVKGRRRLGAA